MPKPSKRDQLVEATKELLWEVGYEAMSPRDIQVRSAAKPGSLYHHFPSKLAIAEVALSEAAAEEIARLEEVFSADVPPLEAVRHYLLLKRDAFRGCRLGRLVHEASIEQEELRRPVAAYFDAVRNHIARCLNSGPIRRNIQGRTRFGGLSRFANGPHSGRIRPRANVPGRSSYASRRRGSVSPNLRSLSDKVKMPVVIKKAMSISADGIVCVFL